MHNFKILIRLLTKQGFRSDIAFDFLADGDAPLAAAARACFELADTMPTLGGISQLDISVCDGQRKPLESLRIRPSGARAEFGRSNSLAAEVLRYFALGPEDVEMFHLAAHGLLAQTAARAVS